MALHGAVIYAPLQSAFSTVSLSAADWTRCLGVASSVLWLREMRELVTRAKNRRHRVASAQCSGWDDQEGVASISHEVGAHTSHDPAVQTAQPRAASRDQITVRAIRIVEEHRCQRGRVGMMQHDMVDGETRSCQLPRGARESRIDAELVDDGLSVVDQAPGGVGDIGEEERRIIAHQATGHPRGRKAGRTKIDGGHSTRRQPGRTGDDGEHGTRGDPHHVEHRLIIGRARQASVRLQAEDDERGAKPPCFTNYRASRGARDDPDGPVDVNQSRSRENSAHLLLLRVVHRISAELVPHFEREVEGRRNGRASGIEYAHHVDLRTKGGREREGDLRAGGSAGGTIHRQ